MGVVSRGFSAAARCFAIAALFIPQAGAEAAIRTNGAPAFVFSTHGAKLAAVVRDMGANYGVPVLVSPRVDGAFIGRVDAMPFERALDSLARLYRLAWYYDGRAIYVYKADEVGADLFTPAYLPVDTLMTELRDTQLMAAGRCDVHPVSGSNAIQVHGVPVCVERVTQFLKRVDEQKLDRERNEEGIELFALKYAAATDATYAYRSEHVTVPGVVSLLREMTQGRTPQLSNDKAAQAAGDSVLPMFSADPRQNAVVVRDKKINLPLYAKLIAQLDHKPKLVEISVTIIDVDEQNLGQLGIDWAATTRIGGGSVTFNGSASPGDFSTIVGNMGAFQVRLSALEQDAKARVLSRPSVLTLDNLQAILDRNVTFYTKLVGEQVAKLESVSTGSLLRVTPRVIESDGHADIMLSLSIEDGRQIDPISRAEPLPQTLNSEVTTQALLKAGQALLLGGFVQDEERAGTRKIPLLGDIPMLGKLFGTTQKASRRAVRLFLLTAEPRTPS
ncbi:EscC/YscC/HrcC family type III secretion system outer membrane ring protein [Trinickia symbiotica]|uniref:Type 3 secretion system secretin n=1 Tax=Trinickia symbiotica TaxID=863227 RepID=A0A2T3XQ24_9BURK|nr:EscC/YscC/HrcC family type III secretion system outer membrane ring protein [Trinickia symbiotica]